MSIDRTVVRQVARLACLELPRIADKSGEMVEPEEHLISDQRLDRLADELNKIIDYVQELKELKLDDVEPTSHGVPLPTKYRNDEVGAPLGVERALKTAPAQSANAFRVPKVIE
jgi:aspartyl-tRNA(Asn)/glutamyl-tRNA(Gln) amidotransferase subunit C